MRRSLRLYHEKYIYEGTINWFPGHMAKATREMRQKLELVDTVMEIRDARIPLSSGNPALEEMIGQKNRIVVLNKADLADPKMEKPILEYLLRKKGLRALYLAGNKPANVSQLLKFAIENVLASKHQNSRVSGSDSSNGSNSSTDKPLSSLAPSFMDSTHTSPPHISNIINNNRNTNPSTTLATDSTTIASRKQTQTQLTQTQRQTQAQTQTQTQTPTQTRVTKVSHLMVVGMPNVGKSTIINSIRAASGKGFNKVAKVGPLPGVTRGLSGFRVSDDPPVFVLDSPGVMVTKIEKEQNERGLKLALVGTIPDSIIGVDVIAEYLLFALNKIKCTTYVSAMGMKEPSNNIDEVLILVAKKFGMKGDEWREMAARTFVDKYRKGAFGRLTLDTIEEEEEEERLKKELEEQRLTVPSKNKT